MGIGAGIVLLAAGAILTSAVEVDLPYVDDAAFGAILLAVGITVLVVSVVLNASRSHGPEDAGWGLALLASGMILIWGLDVDVPYVYDAALGLILIVGGVVAIGASVYLHRQRTRSRRVVEYR